MLSSALACSVIVEKKKLQLFILFNFLQASPRLRFNKEGSLLAVTTNDNGIKILSNNDGLRLIRMLEGRAIEKNRGPPEPINSKVVLCCGFVICCSFILENAIKTLSIVVLKSP